MSEGTPNDTWQSDIPWFQAALDQAGLTGEQPLLKCLRLLADADAVDADLRAHARLILEKIAETPDWQISWNGLPDAIADIDVFRTMLVRISAALADLLQRCSAARQAAEMYDFTAMVLPSLTKGQDAIQGFMRMTGECLAMDRFATRLVVLLRKHAKPMEDLPDEIFTTAEHGWADVANLVSEIPESRTIPALRLEHALNAAHDLAARDAELVRERVAAWSDSLDVPVDDGSPGEVAPSDQWTRYACRFLDELNAYFEQASTYLGDRAPSPLLGLTPVDVVEAIWQAAHPSVAMETG